MSDEAHKFDRVQAHLAKVTDDDQFTLAAEVLRLFETLSEDGVDLPMILPSGEVVGGMSDENVSFQDLVDTEVVQIWRRPNDAVVDVDGGDLHPDTVIALLARGFLRYILSDMYEEVTEDVYDQDDEEDE